MDNTTDKMIEQVANQEAIEQLQVIANSFDVLKEQVKQDKNAVASNTAAFAAVSGAINKLNNDLIEQASKVQAVNGSMELTNKSVDAITTRFASTIKELQDDNTKNNVEQVEAIKNSFEAVVNHMSTTMQGTLDKFVNEVQAASDRVTPVVLTKSTSVRGRSNLNKTDLYDASGGGGGGSSTVSFNPTNYSDNQIATIPASSTVVFTAFNSFSLKAKGSGVTVTVGGNAYTLDDGEMFGWGVTETAANGVTVNTDAASTAVAIYVDA